MGSGVDDRTAEDATLARIDAARRRPARLRDEFVTSAHGAGGKASAALVEAVFVDAFGTPGPELTDGAVLEVPAGRIAYSTDTFVVNPLHFKGGSIGDLAVNGTVNDLAVSGAQPRWLSAGFVLEEGFGVSELRDLVADMRRAADAAGVAIVTGDTKVVPKGGADKVFINTSGIGIIPDGRQLGASLVCLDDRLVLSGSIGRHGMAVMMARGELAIDADIASDTACVSPLVESLYGAGLTPHWMRDATRGGLGTVVNELAKASNLGIVLDDESIPVDITVAACCDMLGIDPLYVANEGCFVAVLPADQADAAVAALHAAGAGQACVVGRVVADPPGIVAVRNGFGGVRILDMLVGDPLPRIC